MLKILLPFPPSVNRLWKTKKTGGMYRSPEYTKWRKAALDWIKAQVGSKHIKGKYTLLIEAVRPDRRHRDIGNIEKAISDILQEAGVIENDCLCEDLHIRWVSEGPECQVTLDTYKII